MNNKQKLLTKREEVEGLLKEWDDVSVDCLHDLSLASLVDSLRSRILSIVERQENTIDDLRHTVKALEENSTKQNKRISELEKENARYKERRFPIQHGLHGGFSIPWRVIAPFEKQAQRNHYQTLERLAERGGLDVTEAMLVLNGLSFREGMERFEKATIDDLLNLVKVRLSQMEPELTPSSTKVPERECIWEHRVEEHWLGGSELTRYDTSCGKHFNDLAPPGERVYCSCGGKIIVKYQDDKKH